MSEESDKTTQRWKVVGYNTLGLLVYTVACRYVDGGIIIDCGLVGIHFLTAIIMSIALRKWEWLLSALIVIVIGFSTCVGYVGAGTNFH